MSSKSAPINDVSESSVTSLTFSSRSIENFRLLLKVVILIAISIAAISSRLFSVVRFESIIHEFDPWFNFRATKYLVSHGFYAFLNWFDDKTWYPLGRVTGGTLYPGLMVTSAVIHKILSLLSLPIDIRNICVLLAPLFSAFTAFVTYLFATEMKDETAGLFAAVFMGIAPGYISRSVAGSYDNEAIAIFLLMMTFYLWIKAIKLGSMLWGAVTAAFYFYMVSAWGGYVFITNLIPLHVFVLLLMGRYNNRIYVAYSSWYALGTLASMQIPFVGFLPIRSSEHMAALGVFGLLQLVAFGEHIRSLIPSKNFRTLVITSSIVIVLIAFVALVGLTFAGVVAPWTGRFYSLWDTNYAKIHIPIIASVSEHQPTAWPSFFFDNFFLIWLFPVGLFFSLMELRDEHVFLIIYGILGSYFAGVMVRLMLTLTPVICVCAAIALSTILDVYSDFTDFFQVTADDSESEPSTPSVPSTPAEPVSVVAAASAAVSRNLMDETPIFEYIYKNLGLVKSIFPKMFVLCSFLGYLVLFVYHCTWVTSNAYSSPSVVLASTQADGSMFLIDDFREAYYWLRMNTKDDARVMSWWDYGYQIGGMADRTTLVDNNTWNNTHIATVGRAMATSEEKAYPILRKHDVDYILIIFGGLIGYSGDDINKFLWMVRIAEGIWPEEIAERKFFTPKGEYRVDSGATQTMRDSLMYKMSYYRFNELQGHGSAAVDRVRGQTIDQPVDLTTLQEVYTSENWLVRIYKVKDLDNLGRDHTTVDPAKGLSKGGSKGRRRKPQGSGLRV